MCIRDSDFDGSGECDVTDLDMLMYTGLGSDDMSFDLDGSGTVDLADRDAWLRAGNSLPGDANFDGVTNASDLNAVGSNWLATDVTSWASGDFNGDGNTDATDLNDLGLVWTNTAEDFAAAGGAAAAPVPEPSSCISLLIALSVLCGFRRSR